MGLQTLAEQGVETEELVPLGCLRAGQSGSVGDVLGDVELVHRLREMGFHHGATVQMIRPGSPCIIGLHGQRLGFRGDDLARILVRVRAMAS